MLPPIAVNFHVVGSLQIEKIMIYFGVGLVGWGLLIW